MTADGELAVMATGDDLGLAVRQSIAMTQEQLVGAYTVVRHSLATDGPRLFEYSFDGQGAVTMRSLAEGSEQTTTASYTLRPDGSLSIDGLEGQVQADGQALVLVDFLAVEKPAMLVGCRQGQGLTASSINGDYSEVAPDAGSAGEGVTFDGAGSWRGAGDSGLYSVGADGLVTAFGMQGIVAPGGEFILLHGGDATGVGMKLLVRKGR